MPLWIQPLFGEAFMIPLSPPTDSWKNIVSHLKKNYYPDQNVLQIVLLHNGETDLSEVKDGDTVHILINDHMAERWVSEWVDNARWEQYGVRFHNSTLSWYDGRWGDPYEDPTILYRTSYTIRIVLRERQMPDKSMVSDFTIDPVYFKERYGPHQTPDETFYPSLREACDAFRIKKNETEGADVFTEQTAENIVRLWEYYHGSNQHLIDQGRYYDY